MKFYRRIAPVKAMTFDLDDTLYDNYPVIVRMERELLSWLKHHHPAVAHMDKTDWLSLKQRVAAQQPELKSDVTLWRLMQLKQAFSQVGYDDVAAHAAAQAAVDVALDWRNRFEVPQQSLDVLAELAQAIPLVAITNGNVDLDRIGLTPYFQQVLKAGPDGSAKPAPDMFTKAQQFLALPRECILHVGDHLVTDVQGAKLSGFAACWFNNMNKNVIKQPQSRALPDVEISCLQHLLTLL
ncbi:5-amino-6-(5-phospho-D-ribitylamino)uracil phosphatase YigB [Vibrio sp. SCSIO 43153]|jgi:putative hydrolase of the HAD superfamily|uniref:5-amino-6-(5-phospho-D-ribitylamino)uracil phosphatase YigB n=1 Tax=Vibrio TaxID=662 RepID=UPI00207638CB|nr:MULTISPECIES: 5-amino-6-(5-phospho-D-ribitylamino)uracil phosphatase YigB [Vibrio]USD49919.1 5-amino-6-(5-phospho-D-ribitylamino)uracil phosphatase YigB [Vibrio sp. SCSIO 43153]